MKQLYTWLNNRIFRNKNLYYKLNLIFALFFFVPVVGMIYFGIHYNLLSDHHLPAFFMVLLVVSLLGLNLLRKVFDEISGFSNNLCLRVKQDFPEDRSAIPNNADELEQLVESVAVLDRRMLQIQDHLSRKNDQIKTLRSLSDICYVTADPDEILYLLLERALALTDSNMGSIMLLERPFREDFVVHTAIGLDKHIRPNDRIKFETSIAKYAVLNKAAVVVADVEKDTRFGRINRPQYGTKAFVCLPIKTSREIIGVLTLSSTSPEKVYHEDDIAVLEPLLSNAAFTYDNLQFAIEQTNGKTYMNAFSNLLELISSSYRGNEMLQATLSEIRAIVPLERAVIFRCEGRRPKEVILLDMWAATPTLLSKGTQYPVARGSALDKALDQQTSLILDNTDTLLDENGIDLFGSHHQQAAMVAPLKIEGTVIGLLVLTAKGPQPFFRAHHHIERAAAFLALALERNRLRDAVERRNRELDSIKQIGGALASSTFDIKQVLNYTMDMIRVIMNVEAGSLYLVNGKELEFAVAFNIEAVEDTPVSLKLGQGIPGYVAARGEAMVANEGHDASLFMPQLNAEQQGCAMRSVLCVPMISQGKVIGVIEVLNKTTGEFTPGDQDLLQSIASSVSIAIENASLYKETVTRAENERSIRRIFQKFVPKEVLDKILHGSGGGMEMLEELKTLTLINIDIRGFSKLAKTMGPQKTVSILNEFFSLMGGIVFKHHGIVDKYLGDGFLALFGAPVSSVADADNAVAASLEMKFSLDALNTKLMEEMGVSLDIGISIHTGEVVVGNIGFEMKMDFTVIGDSVNDVFRLQDKVRPYPNAIFLSQNTLRATRIPLNYVELEQRLGQTRIFELIGFAKANHELQPAPRDKVEQAGVR
jgi:GAF domain-containing protein/class 3 adenylate cyclase